MTRSTFLIALATAATVAIPAYAQEATRSAEVHYGDLKLGNADGAAALKARVLHAADMVCGVSSELSLRPAASAKACARTAAAKAMPQVELALAKAGTDYAANGRMVVAAN